MFLLKEFGLGPNINRVVDVNLGILVPVAASLTKPLHDLRTPGKTPCSAFVDNSLAETGPQHTAEKLFRKLEKFNTFSISNKYLLSNFFVQLDVS